MKLIREVLFITVCLRHLVVHLPALIFLDPFIDLDLKHNKYHYS